MKINKSFEDHHYIDEPELNELREVAQAWSDRAGGKRIRDLVAKLDAKINEAYVKLPLDSEGVRWSGSEREMVYEFDNQPPQFQPSDDNPLLVYGLMYDGINWYFSDHTPTYDATECRHIHLAPEAQITNALSDLTLQFMSDVVIKLSESPSPDAIIELNNEYKAKLQQTVADLKDEVVKL